MEKRHAYLIMAHNNFESLKYLLWALDDKRNDIYLHIDKKTTYVDFDEIRTWVKSSGLYFVPRTDIHWGHVSMIKCELTLLSEATATEHYHYYHLLSGVDFPLKSQDEIHSFFEDKNLEYIAYHDNAEFQDEFLYKVKYYHPYMKWVERGNITGGGKKNGLKRKLDYRQKLFIEKQQKKGVDRTKKYPGMHFVKGENWFSITDDFARYVVSQHTKILKMYSMTNTADEIFLATLAINSEFKDRLEGKSLREIDWERGRPYQFTCADLPQLKNSDKIFARKVSYVDAPHLVRGLMEHIGIKEAAAAEKEPLVTVVVPIYNVEDYLAECLDSLETQTYQKIEVLLIDDGSKDGSANVAKAYEAKDPRFKYISQKNQGLSAARNTGIAKAKGEYISFIDSDDWVEPDYVESMLKTAIENDADLVDCGFIREDGTHSITAFKENHVYSRTGAMNVLDNIFTDDYLLMILACNKLIRTKVMDHVKYTVGKIHEDEYIVHRMIDECDIVCTVTNPLYHYRIRQDSITGANRDEDLRHFHVLDAHLDRVDCCNKQFYGEFYRKIVYSMFEELILLMRRYSPETYKKEHLTGKFRWLMITQCIKNYKQLDSHQKKEYIRAIISPQGYVEYIRKHEGQNN